MRPLPMFAARLLTVGLVVVSLSACSSESRADALERDMHDAAMSVSGVQSAQVHINMNTSGNFMSVKLVGASDDEAALAGVLGEALPPILETTEDLQSGSFAISIFSPDDSVSVGPSDLGYPGAKSLSDFRDYFRE